MIRFLLDSDCAVYAMAGDYPFLRQRLATCERNTLAVSAVSFGEIALGSNLGRPPAPATLEAFFSRIAIIPFDEAAARAYARLPFKRARFDRLLAAHALSIGATVITNNEGDFADVPSLRVENWTLPL